MLVEVPGYRIVRKIGEGGMGVVYEAVQESLGRPVALKILKEELANDRWFVERFLREARAAAAIDHPNITRVYTAGSAGSTYFIAMEFLHGKTVAEMLAQSGRLSLEAACEIGAQVAEGLAHAHARGVVHRDIKPANIMVTTCGTVKIMDMGLAKRLTAETKEGITLTGQVMGTPQYMSPEQIKDSRSVRPATDVYGLGATLYHMLLGEPPFSGKSVGEIMVKVATKTVRFPRRAQEIPAPLRHLIKRMMAKDVRLRPTAEEVAHQLRRMLATGFTVAEQKTALHAETLPKRRTAAPMAALILAAFVVGLVVWLTRSKPPRTSPTKRTPHKTATVPKRPSPPTPQPPTKRTEVDAAVAVARSITNDAHLTLRQRLDEIDRLMVEHPAAKEQLQKIKEDLHRKCEETAEQALKEANSLVEQNRYKEALGLLEKAAARLDGTPAAERVKKETSEILNQAMRAFDGAISELEKRLSASAGNRNEIKSVVQDIKEMESKWGWLLKKEEGKQARERLKNLQKHLEEAKRRQKREELEAEAVELWQRAHEAFRKGRFEEACNLIAELRSGRFAGCDIVRRNFGAMADMMRQIAQKTPLPKGPDQLTALAKLLGLPKKMLRKTKDGFVLTAQATFKDESAEKLWEKISGLWRCRNGLFTNLTEVAKISFRIAFKGDVSFKLRFRVASDTTVALLVCDGGEGAYAGYLNFSPQRRLRIDKEALKSIKQKQARCLVLRMDRAGWLMRLRLPEEGRFYSGSRKELRPEREYEVRLERSGEKIRLYVGGTTAFSGTDRALRTGKVSVYVAKGRVEIAKFEVRGLVDKNWLQKLRQSRLQTSYQRLKRLYEAGRYREMLQEVDRLIGSAGATWVEWCWRGIALLRLSRWEEALVCLDESLKGKESYQAHYWRGLAYLKLTNYTRALEAVKRSLALEARNRNGWELHALCSERLGQKREAALARKRATAAPSANLLPTTKPSPPPPSSPAGGAVITGRVVDKAKNPVEGALVVGIYRNLLLKAHTDTEGNFTLKGFPKNVEVMLRVYKLGLGYATKKVKTPASGVEIRMPRTKKESNLSERMDLRSKVRELEKSAKQNYPNASREDLRRLHKHLWEAAKDPVSPEEALKWWERGLNSERNKGKTEILRGMLNTWELWKKRNSFPWWQGRRR